MELSHRFSVPTPVEVTWDHFNDIAGVAQCFPGAQVTDVSGDTFTGSAKVKLGPIALVYNGSGSFVEKDEAARKFVVEAKGKDKRGNGTAGATVTVTMSPSASSDGTGTDLEVLTDLAVTGKPAQFGRGVMQDVSDKLLGQFVACLEQRLSAAAAPAVSDAAVPAGEASATDDGATEAAADSTPQSAVADPSPQPASERPR
ncbi:MAG: SRPBCC family protein, partial [Nocardioides sp.]